jgi:hypothetical protein
MMDWVAMAIAKGLAPADSATKNFVPSTRHRHRRHIDYRENGMVHHCVFPSYNTYLVFAPPPILGSLPAHVL